MVVLQVPNVWYGLHFAPAATSIVFLGPLSMMALRLKYAGWPEDAIEVIEPIEESVDAAVSAAPNRLFALPTYTALLELRTLLTDRGLAADYWQ